LFENYAMPFTLVDNLGSGNTISGGSGTDILLGFDGNDTLIGNGGNDTLIGGAGSDTFKGGAGNDAIWGGDENDNAIEVGGHDRVDYSAEAKGITLGFAGSSQLAVISVRDGSEGIDHLYGIEEIVGSAHQDRFAFSGVVPNGYSLTLSSGGGDTLSQFLVLRDASTHMTFTNTNDGGTLTSAGSTGHITLVGFHTDILGSDYDDTIVDDATGAKKIDGGAGDDSISVSVGAATILGGDGDDTIQGGAGNDVVNGEGGVNTVDGGGGSDLLISDSSDDWLSGGDGHDYLYASSLSSWAILEGGAGNDVIDARESGDVLILFGEGGGHDVVLAFEEPGGSGYTGVATIDLSTLSKGDVTFVWSATVVSHEHASGEIFGGDWLRGDLAIVVDSTGESILIRDVAGFHGYFGDDDGYEGAWQALDIDLPEILFADGTLDASAGWGDASDFTGASPSVQLALGSTAAYDTAEADWAAAVAAAPEAVQGTEGDDQLGGGNGDDSVAAGDGDDHIQASAGHDEVDGGAGDDTFDLFGSAAAFGVARGADGIVTLTDFSLAEGETRLVSVETVHSASDGESWALADLIRAYHAAPGGETLVGNDRDNRFDGGAGDDALSGGGGDDVFMGAGGDDLLDGGAGEDEADYWGALADYAVTLNADGTVTVADLVGDEGSDTLSGIERLFFYGDNAAVDVGDLVAAGAAQGLAAAAPVVPDFFA
jgi:Ca2+-binding RTX toxin-like protein